MKPTRATTLILLGFMIVGYQNCAAPFDVAKLDSTSSASSGTPAPTKTGKVTVFMASGHMQRTVYSCDDGKTWINDISADNNARCWVGGDPNYVECDHSPYAGHGLDSYNGAFYAQFGWGYNGSIRKSVDGVNWTDLKTDSWGGGVAAIRGKLYSFMGNWFSSDDDGKTWTAQNQSALASSLDHATIAHVGNHLFAVGRVAHAMSDDNGATWRTLTGYDMKWGGTFTEGNGRIISVGSETENNTGASSLWSAASTDGGLTWQSAQLATGQWLSWQSNPVFNGSEFVVLSWGYVWKSTDGLTWTKEAVSVQTSGYIFGGPISYNPKTGTYVMISSVWGNYYDRQKAFRSTDGKNWVMLDTDHFKGGHPIASLVLGQLDASACP